MKIQFEGSTRNVVPVAEEPTGGVSNYYRGSDRRKWIEDVPNYRQVRYAELYPGIDLVFHGRTRRLEYDFEVAPGASPDQIVLQFDPANAIALDSNGALIIHAGEQKLTFLAPEAFQQDGAARISVAARYHLAGEGRVSFDIGPYDRTKALVIDPVVVYTRIIGMDNATELNAIAADSSGNLLLTGQTRASNYPQTTGSPADVSTYPAFYLTKLDSAGETILFSTELTAGHGMHLLVDASGNAYVSGLALDSSFPTTSQTLGVCGSFCNTGFAAKFDNTGHLSYSTMLGWGQIIPRGIALSGGELLIAGEVTEDSIATVNAFQPTYQGLICTSCANGFFLRLNASGTAFQFASYFGTNGWIHGITLDSAGNIYLAGRGEIPLVNPFIRGGDTLYIAKFTPDGQTLTASSRFGGHGDAAIAGLATTTSGNICLGATTQGDYTYTLNAYRLPQIPNAYASTYLFAVASCFKPDLSGFTYSTYLGIGSARAAAVDSTDHFYVAGDFRLEPFPVKNAVVSDLSEGGFIVALDKNGTPTQSTQFGGHNEGQVPNALAVDGSGNMFIAGVPASTLEKYANVLDPVNVGTGTAYSRQSAIGTNTSNTGYTIFAAKISPSNLPQISLSYRSPFLVLRDAGSADLHISSVTGTAAQGGNCTSVVPAGRSCVLYGSGSITIKSDAQPSTQTFSPAGGGSLSMPLLVEPASLYIGPQQLDTPSPAQALKLTNVQGAAQPIASITASGSVSQSNNCPSSLDPGASCTVNVTLTPPFDMTSSFSISLSDTNNIYVPIHMLVPGTQGPLAASTPFILFGTVPVGSTSIQRVVNITNSSNTPMSTPTATISGPATFSVTGTTCGSSLPAHQSCAFGIQYTPLTNGDATATLTIAGGGGSVAVPLSATGAIPSAVTVNPLQLTMYGAILGKERLADSLLTLTNTSSAPVSITGIQFGLADYQQTNDCPSPIPALGSCTISVSIIPQDVGDRSTVLTIFFDTAATQKIPISAIAAYPLEVEPSTLNFSAITPVGVDSNPRYVYLNNSQGTPVDYTVAITGDFVIPSNSCGTAIAAYMGCGIPIVFHPTKSGPQQGTLTVSIPGITQQQVVTLTGDTSSPGIVISPGFLNDFSAQARTVSAPQVLTLKNPETFPVTVPQPTITGTDADQFQATDPCTVLNPGETCQVSVAFAPTKSGALYATLTFDNGGTPPAAISYWLKGDALPAPGFWLPVAYGNVGDTNLGTTSGTFTFEVKNSGPVPLALPQLTLGGPNADEFVVTPDIACANVAASGGTCSVSVVFTPKGSGRRSAVISFSSLATTPKTLQFSVYGFGADFYGIAGNTSRTISSGGTANFDVLFEESSNYSGVVKVTCAPVGESYGPCTANPDTLQFSNGTDVTHISISKATTAQMHDTRFGWNAFFVALMLPLGLTITRTQSFRQRVAIAVLAIGFLGMASCGGGTINDGGGAPPPAKVYTYRVTAVGAEGGATHTLTLSVYVLTDFSK